MFIILHLFVCIYVSSTQGDWEGDTRHGIGTQTFADGSVYQGSFLSDQRTGEGRLYVGGALKYEGGFKEGLFHGHGVLHFADGTVFRGRFADGQRHGAGSEVSSGGGTYEGDWEKDMRKGHGKVSYSNGDRSVRLSVLTV